MKKNIIIALLALNLILWVFVLGREVLFWSSLAENPATAYLCPSCGAELTIYEADIRR